LILREKLYEFFDQNKLDALLLPATSSVAFKHGYSNDLSIQCAETMFCNALNLPAGVVPVTVVKPNEEDYSRETSGRYWDQMSSKMDENLKGSAGMPVSV